MPSPKDRNKKRRKVFRKTPSGETKEVQLDKKPGKAKCGNCGSELHGVPHKKASKMKNTPKTEKRPERPYGGNLCSSCMREKIKAQASIE